MTCNNNNNNIVPSRTYLLEPTSSARLAPIYIILVDQGGDTFSKPSTSSFLSQARATERFAHRTGSAARGLGRCQPPRLTSGADSPSINIEPKPRVWQLSTPRN